MDERTLSEYRVHEGTQLDAARTFGLGDAVEGPSRAVRQAVEGFATRTAEIEADRNRSAEGRVKDIGEAQSKCDDLLVGLHRTLVEPIAAQVATDRASVERSVADSLPQPSDLKLRAMAEVCAKLDTVQRGSLYAGASSVEDRVALEALASQIGKVPVVRAGGDVAWEDFLDASLLAEFKEARLAERAPEAMARIARMERLRGILAGLTSAARTVIREAASRRGVRP